MSKAGMANRNLLNRFSHLFLRALTGLTVSSFMLFLIGDHYFKFDPRALEYRISLGWTGVSVVFLPLYLLAEIWRMRKLELETKPLLIDAGFVVFWILVLFGAMLYSLTHYAIL